MTTARTITNAWIHRTLPDIFYEEPEPVEDGMQQELPIYTIKRCIWERYRGRNDVFVSNAVFISYDKTDGNARVNPDLFIAFGVDAAAIRENLPNFWIWETGKVPDFVMEVASPSTAANDTGPKRSLYQRLGVTEYWRFDPTGGELYGQPMLGERLIGSNYIPCEITAAPDGSQRSRSQLLNLDFSWNGAEFDVLDPATGKSIDIAKLLIAEQEARQAAQAQAAQARAEIAHQAAQAQAAQAEAAHISAQAEIARLRRQLRRYEPE